jgi:hypothetical protein
MAGVTIFYGNFAVLLEVNQLVETFEPDIERLEEAYIELSKLWTERINNHYPGLTQEPLQHIVSLEQMRFRFRPEQPKLIFLEESHHRSPEWAESRWCFKSKGPAIVYNPQFSQTTFWKFMIPAASLNIGDGPNRPDHRKHVMNELKKHGFWIVHISIFGITAIDKLCGSKGFYSPEFCLEVDKLAKKKRKTPFRLTQLNGVDNPESIEFDIMEESYKRYTSFTLAATNCPILAKKGNPKDFCLRHPELKERMLDLDFEPKNVEMFLEVYKKYCLS